MRCFAVAVPVLITVSTFRTIYGHDHDKLWWLYIAHFVYMLVYIINFTNILAYHAASVILSAIWGGGGAQAALPHTQQRESRQRQGNWACVIYLWKTVCHQLSEDQSDIFVVICFQRLRELPMTGVNAVQYTESMPLISEKWNILVKQPMWHADRQLSLVKWHSKLSSTPGFIHKLISVFRRIMNDLMTLS